MLLPRNQECNRIVIRREAESPLQRQLQSILAKVCW